MLPQFWHGLGGIFLDRFVASRYGKVPGALTGFLLDAGLASVTRLSNSSSSDLQCLLVAYLRNIVDCADAALLALT